MHWNLLQFPLANIILGRDGINQPLHFRIKISVSVKLSWAWCYNTYLHWYTRYCYQSAPGIAINWHNLCSDNLDSTINQSIWSKQTLGGSGSPLCRFCVIVCKGSIQGLNQWLKELRKQVSDLRWCSFFWLLDSLVNSRHCIFQSNHFLHEKCRGQRVRCPKMTKELVHSCHMGHHLLSCCVRKTIQNVLTICCCHPHCVLSSDNSLCNVSKDFIWKLWWDQGVFETRDEKTWHLLLEPMNHF